MERGTLRSSHYYRAMVGRADTWRLRMDATTNWAIGATAALISFGLAEAALPHFVIFLSSYLTLIFLLLEGRRLTFYHLWQQRVLLLERALIAPAARPSDGDIDLRALDRELGPHLGHTAPTMSIAKAVSRRLRRVYLYLFLGQFLAWLFKLWLHPEPASSIGEAISRARLGPVDGPVVFGLVVALLLSAVGFAITRGGRSTEPASSDA